MNQYVTPKGLKDEGWTASLIGRHLGEPDSTEPNPYYRTAGAPMRLYLRSRVATVAGRPEVKEQLAQAVAKRMRRRESSGRAVQTKISNARQNMRNQIGSSLENILKEYTAEQLIAEACESYNRGDAVPDRAFRKRNGRMASANSDPDFLKRICCNYVRHQLLDYDHLLGGYTGTVEARALAHKLVKKVVKRILKTSAPRVSQVAVAPAPPSSSTATNSSSAKRDT